MNYVKLAEQAVKASRKEVGRTPENVPILWKGLRMSVNEACAVILVLEKERAKYLKRYRNTEAGSRVIKIAFDGTGEVLDATAKGLKVNPLTSIAGYIVGGVERNVTVVGEIISKGVNETGKFSNLPLVEDLEMQIRLLENWVKDAN